MEKRMKRILAGFLACVLAITAGYLPVQAEGGRGADAKAEVGAGRRFNGDAKYAIVASSTGTAVNVTGLGWQKHMKAEAVYHPDSNKLEDEGAQFILKPVDAPEGISITESQACVKILYQKGEETYSVRTETDNDYTFADLDKRGVDDSDAGNAKQCTYIVTLFGDGPGTLKAASNGRYATIDNGELRFAAGTEESQAEVFEFQENPGILNTSVSLEHKHTGKYMKTYREEGKALTVDGESGDEGVAFSKLVCGSNGTTETGAVYPTVTLVSKDYGNGLMTYNGGAAEKVQTSNMVSGNGWESIRMLANGDGTVSFQDVYFGQYITVDELGELKLCGLPKGTEPEDLTDNEKFILHTELAPKAAEGLAVDIDGRTRSSIPLAWKNPQGWFSGVEIERKEGDGEFHKIAEIGGEPGGAGAYEADGLEADVTYTFRIRMALYNGTEALYSPYSQEVSGTVDKNQVFDRNAKYAIVSRGNGNAVNVTDLGYLNHMKVEAAYDKASNKLGGEGAQFTIQHVRVPGGVTLTGQQTCVKILYQKGEEVYSVRTETGNDYTFADSDKRGVDDSDAGNAKQCTYIVTLFGDGSGTLKAASNGRYATIDNGELRFAAGTEESQAEVFEFQENPGILDTTLSIEHKQTGKYIKTYQEEGRALTVDGEEGGEGSIFSDVVYGANNNSDGGKTYPTVTLVSKAYGNGLRSVLWKNDAADASRVLATNKEDIKGGGWESIRVLANGDGTVSFKDVYYGQYITVKDNELAGRLIPKGAEPKDLTDNEKFILHTELAPQAAEGLAVEDGGRTQASIPLSWKNPQSLFSGVEIEMKKGNGDFETISAAGGEPGGDGAYEAVGLEEGASYTFRIRVALHNGTETLYSPYSQEVTAKTRSGVKPETPKGVHITEAGEGKYAITWDAAEHAQSYKLQRAKSLYADYQDMEGEVIGTKFQVSLPSGDGTTGKYDYYRVVAVNGDEHSEPSAPVSLETELFGSHTVFFAPTDDIKQVDKFIADLFEKQNDYGNDAQFKGEQWQIYFKPGDYTETACMNLGFYTSFNGLGKTPLEVRLNNIAIPAYLPGGALGAGEDNATCNFWRSAENLSVINTGNPQGAALFGAEKKGRQEYFNWAVAQAAPLRRVYSTRQTAYDWNFGWASGGYVADCWINVEDNGKKAEAAGTHSGQQFFTRNTKVEGNTYGTTLNNFYMGVEAQNNLSASSGSPLRQGNGYTNWGIASAEGGHQVVTEIASTPEISEKPFLYLDGGEYKVFVPAVQKNRRGISWGEGNMGEGTSLPLGDFYIARPEDTAEQINKQISDGKNIYFTPGVYHAEVPIVVNRENAILLGTGMASIIPDNGEMAMKVEDLEGIRIEGLIFDAGEESDYLLQVGDRGKSANHSANPIILQDLFFRVGGTTDKLTKANDALEINSSDVIGDHFWIWRADHGAGVEWYGNESKHGLIVNGDRVRCYALFNEHFQEYHTLWNGEDGATYFYQNETCYDPISQEAWMSHGGTMKGYSSYKVSNDVKNHYAVGLGIYNVFIYTGPSYNSTGVGIELDNAVEVPNAPGVLVENACTQTFANDGPEYSLTRINHIVNGVGGSVSSGTSKETGEIGESWSRKFLLYYNNGSAQYGKETASKDQSGKFIGLEEQKYIEAPADESIYLERIQMLHDKWAVADEGDYTKKSWYNAGLAAALLDANAKIEEGKAALDGDAALSQMEISELQSRINAACTKLEAAAEKLIYIKKAMEVKEAYTGLDISLYQPTAMQKARFEDAVKSLQDLLEECEGWGPTTKKEIYGCQMKLDAAWEEVVAAAKALGASTPGAVGLEKLKEAYSRCSALKQPDYTADSWKGFAEVLEEVRVFLEKDESDMSQEEADSLLARLAEAEAALVKGASPGPDVSPDGPQYSGNLKELLELYYKYLQLNLDSQAAFQKALAELQALTSANDRTQEQINVMLSGILDAALKDFIANNGNKDTVTGVEKVMLNKNSAILNKGAQMALTASVSPALTASQEVVWSSSNTSVATVDKNGLVKARAKGSAKITATSVQGGKSATCKVTVKVPARKITLHTKKIYLVKGKSITIKAKTTPSGSTDTISWASSKPSVASVKKGKVKAKKTGAAKITAKSSSGKKASCTVRVVKKPVSVDSIQMEKKMTLEKGKWALIPVVTTPKAATDKIVWKSSNPKVAHVDAYGFVTGKKKGSATITAISGSKKAKCKVTVK